MQGSETEDGVVRSLERIAGHLDKFDVAVIIRGGGSQADLSWFDNYKIAYYITQFPIPVLTGIGHEKDLSVTDIVAWQALKTPTAVADFLIECIVNAEDQLFEMSRGITETSRMIIEENKNRLDSSRLRLIPLARMLLSDFREQLSEIRLEMINTGKEYLMKASLYPENHRSRLISGARSFLTMNRNSISAINQTLPSRSAGYLSVLNNNITGLKNSLKILDPVNVLRRGYSITSRNGKIVKSRTELSKEDIIDTRFSDGSVKSSVI
jgi:exodeoxyribonuclease VII large subunit